MAAISVLSGCTLFGASALAAAPKPLAPKVVTGVAGTLTYQSATLSGTANPSGESTEVYFQYGTTNKYGLQSPPTQLPAGTSTVAVSIPIASLAAATVYHYRIVATNATGTSLGDDRSFLTDKIPLSLAITAAPNPVAFGGSVTVQGTLSGTGSANAPVQLQANPFPYTAGFVNVGNAELTSPTGAFLFNVLGLATGTQYRVISGSTASVDVVVDVGLTVTLHTRAVGTHRRPKIRFSGTIAPAEPSARVAIERLVGTTWKSVGGTVAQITVNNGMVNFATKLRIYHSGFFRALVLPVEGGHVSGYSPTVFARIK